MLLAFPELSTVRLVFFSADAVHGSVCPVLASDRAPQLLLSALEAVST